MLKKILPYILIAIATIIVYRILFVSYDIKTDIESYEAKINALEQKVDSLHSENNLLELQADSLEQQLDASDLRIKKLNSRIYVIKKETQKQLDAVDLFGDDDLERFFSKRYTREADSIN